MKLSIAVIGIGTELTTGQILNRNAQWISKKLKDLGAHVSLHTVVPDDPDLIKSAFDYCQRLGISYVFVTGGLGPTSDDFTRNIASEWLGLPLEWQESAWKHIQDYFESRKLQVREIQRQQCYFPQSASILKNLRGTAHGFAITKANQQFFVLPGPPLEIEGMWPQLQQEYLQAMTQNIDRKITHSWECIGIGESVIAEQVEQIISPKEYELGYRAHPPYVEFKVTYPESQQLQVAPLLQKIEDLLKSKIALRNGADIADNLGQLMQGLRVCVWDNLTMGFLNERLLRATKLTRHLSFHNGPIAPERNDQVDLVLSLRRLDDHTALCEMIYQEQHRVQYLSSPYSAHLNRERGLKFFAESAMLFWTAQLGS